MSKTQLIVRVREVVKPKQIAHLKFFFANKVTLTVFSNVKTSAYGSLGIFRFSTCFLFGGIWFQLFLLSEGFRSSSFSSDGIGSSPVPVILGISSSTLPGGRIYGWPWFFNGGLRLSPPPSVYEYFWMSSLFLRDGFLLPCLILFQCRAFHCLKITEIGCCSSSSLVTGISHHICFLQFLTPTLAPCPINFIFNLN